MKVEVSINGKDIKANLSRNKGPEGKLRKITDGLGIDWESAEIFVANFPEPGRYLQKSSNRKSVQAGG